MKSSNFKVYIKNVQVIRNTIVDINVFSSTFTNVFCQIFLRFNQRRSQEFDLGGYNVIMVGIMLTSHCNFNLS